MMQGRTHFGIGLCLGVVVTAVFFHFFAPRYEVVNSESATIKQDRWSGDTWRLEGDQWRKVMDTQMNWQPVDDALMKELNIPTQNDSQGPGRQIAALKKKYPVLETVSDEEIMERIKYIYARKIMVDLYFDKTDLK